MRKLSIGAAVAGLLASIASAIDYFGGAPTVCSDDGCGAVRASFWSHPLGIPMPLLGIAFFAVAGVLAITRRREQKLVAAGGAVWAVALIALQALVIGAWCKLCLVADTAAIVFALATFTKRPAIAIAPAFATAIGIAMLSLAPKAPPVVVAHAPTAIIEVVDFECPHCRKMAARVTEAIAKANVPVTIERRMMPLAQHPHAFTAALAYCCADWQGKGDAMAEKLLAADPASLTEEGCENLAVSVGCDRERYRRDRILAVARVASEGANARAQGVRSLPTIVIGHETVVGATKTTEQLVDLLRRI